MSEIQNTFDSFYFSILRELIEFKKESGIVAGLFERQFPLSLLSGFNIWPVRVLSGTNTIAESAGETIVRPDACAYCKSILGNFLNKNDIHQYIDIVIGVITCDQMRRTLERLQYSLSVPVFPLQLPCTRSFGTEEYYVEGVKDILSNISTFLDKEIDQNMILQDYKYRYKNAMILKKMLLEGDKPPTIIHKLLYLNGLSRPKAFNEFLNTVVSQFPKFEPYKKIILIGNILCKEDYEIIRILEREKVFPILKVSSGLNEFDGYMELYEATNIIDQLAKMVFNQPQEIRSRPNNEVYSGIREMLFRTKADGIICKTINFCDLWNTENAHMKEEFYGTPFLMLNSGYSLGSQSQLETRLETFLETL